MEDLETIKKHHEAFWEGSALERCCLSISVSNGKAKPYYKDPDLDKQRTSFPYRYSELQRMLTETEYFGDALCNYFVDLGPGMLAACVGGSYEFGPDTVWFDKEPIIEGWEAVPKLELDKTARLYQVAVEHTEQFLEKCDGSYVVSLPDIGGTYDVLAALRGTQDLLYDLYDEPESVKAVAKTVSTCWKQMFDDFSSRLMRRQSGMTSWMPIWSGVPYFPLQCDFSAMLSPDMFGEFVIGELRETAASIGRAIYHLDGPGEIPHLPQLLAAPEINAIQWTSGAGNADLTDPCWFEMYHQIQAAGKGIVLLGAAAEGLENLLNHISTKGVFISVDATDAAQARELLKMAETFGVK